MSYEFLTRSQAASKLSTSITGGGEGSEFITKTEAINLGAKSDLLSSYSSEDFVPDVSIQSALRVLLNYNGLTNRFIEGSPTYITEGISDSSITSNGTIFSGTNGYLVKTFGNTTLNKYYPEFKITCSGYLRDLRDITKDILYPVYSGNIKYNLSDVQIRLLIKLVQAPNTLGIYGDIVNSTGSSIETFKLFNLSVYNQRFISIIKIKEGNLNIEYNTSPTDIEISGTTLINTHTTRLKNTNLTIGAYNQNYQNSFILESLIIEGRE